MTTIEINTFLTNVSFASMPLLLLILLPLLLLLLLLLLCFAPLSSRFVLLFSLARSVRSFIRLYFSLIYFDDSVTEHFQTFYFACDDFVEDQWFNTCAHIITVSIVAC